MTANTNRISENGNRIRNFKSKALTGFAVFGCSMTVLFGGMVQAEAAFAQSSAPSEYTAASGIAADKNAYAKKDSDESGSKDGTGKSASKGKGSSTVSEKQMKGYELKSCGDVVGNKAVIKLTKGSDKMIGMVDQDGKVLWLRKVEEFPEVLQDGENYLMLYYKSGDFSTQSTSSTGITYHDPGKIEIVDLDGNLVSSYGKDDFKDLTGVKFGGGYTVMSKNPKSFDDNELLYEIYSPEKKLICSSEFKGGYELPDYIGNGIFKIHNSTYDDDSFSYIFTGGSKAVEKPGFTDSAMMNENISSDKIYAGFEEGENRLTAVFYDKAGSRQDVSFDLNSYGGSVSKMNYWQNHMLFRDGDENWYLRDLETGSEKMLDPDMASRLTNVRMTPGKDGPSLLLTLKGADGYNYIQKYDSAFNPVSDLVRTGFMGASGLGFYMDDDAVAVTATDPEVDPAEAHRDDIGYFLFDSKLNKVCKIPESIIQDNVSNDQSNTFIHIGETNNSPGRYLNLKTGEIAFDPASQLNFKGTVMK